MKKMTEVSFNKQAKLSEHLTSSSVATLGHSSELDGSRLSPHFTLGELCKTSAKTADGNIPSLVHIENLKRLCGWLEQLRRRPTPSPSLLREGSEEPIIINSGYRSPEVKGLLLLVQRFVLAGDLEVVVMTADIVDALTLEVGDALGMEDEVFEGIADAVVGGLNVDDGA